MRGNRPAAKARRSDAASFMFQLNAIVNAGSGRTGSPMHAVDESSADRISRMSATECCV
jgi:hypothetical protein